MSLQVGNLRFQFCVLRHFHSLFTIRLAIGA
ncbi:hypothetical protein BGLA2_3570002 [Burkholderia gladioli]|nr:hypothetical protein BGLA2_3570002 [Burkholderia gladioli]